MISVEWTCPNCKKTYQLPEGLVVTCTCKLIILPPHYIERQKICDGCKFVVPKGCALYIQPCTVKQLWHDQIDPPTQCPKAEAFL